MTKKNWVQRMRKEKWAIIIGSVAGAFIVGGIASASAHGRAPEPVMAGENSMMQAP